MADITSQLSAALADRYRIESRLGEGGMATVYLAEDLKHDRRVAVKVLRPELTAVLGAERFVQEIKTVASLQHPNILPLHDSGEAHVPPLRDTERGTGGEAFLYYVMPFVDGESLRDRLRREQQLPVGDAVRIARDVATALDYAHRQNVIHRDIKPENIMLYEGQALVTDFGIALAVRNAGGERLTETGLSIGTPAYMSPEQTTGERTLDGRSDLFSLGSVTYEMLAGRPPFDGASVQAVLSKILTEPSRPVRTERPSVPPNVDAAVTVALAKLPADRFTSASAFADALTDEGFAASGLEMSDGAGGKPTPLRYAWPAIAVAGLVLAWLGWRRPAPKVTVERVHIDLPAGQRLSIPGGRAHPFAISPDGTRIVYQIDQDGTSRLYVRDLNRFESRALDGTDGARQPFFSPDGRWVGFFADESLQRVSVDGGAPIAIADAPGVLFGASWGSGDRILYARAEMLYLVDAAGSAPPAALPLDVSFEGVSADASSAVGAGNRPRWPHVLPDGTHALVTTNAGTVAVDLATQAVKYVFPGSQAVYVPTGHLLYHAGQERVRAVPFDLDRLEVTGPEIPLIENVFRAPGSGAANFSVATKAGALVYLQGGFNRRLVLVDRSGRRSPIPAEPRGYRFPSVSPDGRYLAVTVDPRPSDLWIVDIERGSAERQQTDSHDGWGVWSPDGRRVAFVWGEAAPLGWRAYPFRGPPNPIMRQTSEASWPSAWAPDDHLLAMSENDIVSIAVSDGTVRSLVATDAIEMTPALSHDGRWIAYASDQSGAFEIYVNGYPEAGERYAVSVGGGADPVWAWDGHELYYRNGNTIMAVPVQSDARFEVLGPPEELFSGAYDFTQDRNWTVRPTGEFVMVESDPTILTRFYVVLNWFEELKASVGN